MDKNVNNIYTLTMMSPALKLILRGRKRASTELRNGRSRLGIGESSVAKLGC